MNRHIFIVDYVITGGVIIAGKNLGIAMAKPTTKLLLLVLLLIAAINFWLITIMTTTIVSLPPDAFFYAKQLPFIYWVGLGIVGIVIFLSIQWRKNDGKNYTLTSLIGLFVLILYLFGSPQFIYENPRELDSYSHTLFSYSIISMHNTSGYYYPSQYPGGFAFFAQLFPTTNIDPIIVMKFYPIFVITLVAICIYIISRVFTRSSPYAVIAPIFFVGSAWFQEFHVSPQSIGLVLYLILWVVFMKLFYHPSFNLKILVLLILVSIVVTHPGTPIFIIFNLGIIVLLYYIVKKGLTKDIKLLRNCGIPFIVTVVLWFSWLVFISVPFLFEIARAVGVSLQNIFRTPAQISFGIAGPEFEYGVAVTLRKLLAILTCFFASIIFFLLLILKKQNRADVLLFGGWFGSTLFFSVFSIFCGGGFIERPFLFASIPAGCLVAFFFTHKYNVRVGLKFFRRKHGKKKKITFTTLKAIVGITICMSVLIFPISKNSYDPFEYSPSSALHAAGFAAERLKGDVVLMSSHSAEYSYIAAVKYAKYLDADFMGVNIWNMTYHRAPMYFKYSPYHRGIDLNVKNITRYNAVIFIDYVQNGFVMRFNDVDFPTAERNCELQVGEIFNRIYDDGSCRIYVKCSEGYG